MLLLLLPVAPALAPEAACTACARSPRGCLQARTHACMGNNARHAPAALTPHCCCTPLHAAAPCTPARLRLRRLRDVCADQPAQPAAGVQRLGAHQGLWPRHQPRVRRPRARSTCCWGGCCRAVQHLARPAWLGSALTAAGRGAKLCRLRRAPPRVSGCGCGKSCCALGARLHGWRAA